jgi:hypothetical protein
MHSTAMKISQAAARHVSLGLVGVLVSRMMLAFFLVFATYNPGGMSWYHWVRDPRVDGEWRVIGSAVLLLAYVATVPAAGRALGIAGVALAAAVLGAIAGVLVELGVLPVATATQHAWLTLSMIASVLGIGLTWMTFAIAFDGQPRTRDLTAGL